MEKTLFVLKDLMDISHVLGEITSVNMYDPSFISVKGKTKDGKEFELNFFIKKENKDA